MQLEAMPPTEHPESYWSDPQNDLSRAQLAETYHHYHEASIQRAGYILACLFVFFASLHWLFSPLSIRTLMTMLAASSSVVFFSITYVVRSKALSRSTVFAYTLIIAFLVLGNGITHLYLSQEPWQVSSLVFSVIGIGFFFIERWWFTGFVVLAALGWFGVSSLIEPKPEWPGFGLHYHIVFLTACVLAMMIHLVLANLVKRVAALRVRDTIQKRKMQTAVQDLQANEMELQKAMQQTKESLRLTETLYHVNQAINTASDLEGLLSRVSKGVASELPAAYVTLYILDVEHKQIVDVMMNASPRGYQPADFTQLMHGIVGWSIREQKPALLKKGSADVRDSSEAKQQRMAMGLGSLIVAPMVYKEESIGLLLATNLFADADFSEKDCEILSTIAGQAAVAIANTRLADEVRHQAKEFNRMVANAAAPIFAVNKKGELIQWSDAMHRMVNVPFSQAKGLDFVSTFVAESHREVMRKQFSQAFAGVSSEAIECPVIDSDGRMHITQISCNAFRDADGKITAIVGIGQDITRRREAEENLQRSNEQLESRVTERTHELQITNDQLLYELKERTRVEEELRRKEEELGQRIEERTKALSLANAELNRAARLKDEFLANMSHELRTPLSAVLGLSEALQEEIYGSLNERQHKTVLSVVDSSRLLLSLINDILDISKIEAGKFDLERDWVQIEPLIATCVELIYQSAQKKSINIDYDIDPLVTTVYADERRLKQILVNLLSNAVKFTPINGVVRLDIISSIEQQIARFVVTDTGIGIAQEDLARLFQPFVQLDSSLVRQHPGTGLGLALVYRMTRMHGGSITVESEVGHGSRFIISLPWDGVQIADLSAEKVVTPVSSNGSHTKSLSPHERGTLLVLIADDNETTIDAFSDYLITSGYRIATARSGKEAIDTAIELSPAIILMDINMPEMDGISAIRHIRKTPEIAQTPIIAITAMAMPGDRERCLEAGANDYLSKPVSLRMVLTTIEHYLQSQPA